MAIANYVPLMRAGSTIRNVVVGIGYFFTVWLWIFLLPFIAAVFVWRNAYGWADALDGLPGIGAGGGLVAGGVAFVYVFVLIAVLGAVLSLGGGGDGTTSQAADGQADAGGAATTPAPATETVAATPAPTPEPTPTPAPTPEPTPTPDEPVHEVGESFVVGNGDQTVGYTVTDVRVANSIGGEFGVEADGVFLIVDMEMTNNAQESFLVDSSLYSLVDSEGREYEVDSEAVGYVEESLLLEQVDPDVTTTGTLVYDVPTDQEGRQLQLQPAGFFSTARTHYVDLPSGSELTPTETPKPDYSVRVEYEGEWSGSLLVSSDGDTSQRSISDDGSTTIEIDESSVSSISANAQKQTDNTDTLTIQLLKNGEVIAESSTDAEYGVAQVSESFY